MSFILIVFGIVFLTNPELAYLIDFLPDFLGYAIILSAIKKLAYLNDDIYIARQSAIKLLWFSLIKLFVTLAAVTFSEMNILLVVFSLAVIETIMLVPFIGRLFSGLDYLASRHGSEKTLKRSKGGGFLKVFFVIKNILWIIPVAIPLLSPENSGDYSKYYFINFDFVKRGASILVFLITSLLALVAIALILSYAIALKRDRLLKDSLNSLYRERVLENGSLLIRIRLSRFFTLTLAGCLLLADFYLDFVDFIPSLIGFLIFLIFSFSTEKFKIPMMLLSIAGIFADGFCYVQRFNFDGSADTFTSSYSIAAGAITALLKLSLLVISALLVYKLIIKYAKVRLFGEYLAFIILSVTNCAIGFVLYSMPQFNQYVNFPALILTAIYFYSVYNLISKAKYWTEKIT